MCGIIGVWHKETGTSVDVTAFDSARDMMTHRGPDDAGSFVDGSIALGHRRLSIIDTSSHGHQPMMSSDERYVLTFNGEIYNFQELKEEFLSDVVLQSTSDTEVLLHLLIRQGEKILPRLRGMFAFAFWDKEKEELLVARDPFGKKPVYYSEERKDFFFASEVKALQTLVPSGLSLDEEAIPSYLLFEYVPSSATGYKEVKQLPMGSFLKVAKDGVTVEQWWKPTFTPKSKLSSSEIVATFDGLLRQAVERRLIADVPVGVFLSGGLDSTTIAWYMRELLGKKNFHSFSVKFDEETFDESSYATMAANAVGSIHHDVLFSLPEFKRTAEQVLPKMDIPLADASLLPTYLVSELARKTITVALDGDGGDELLGGYGTFAAAQVADALPFKQFLTSFLQEAAGLLPTGYGNFTFDFKVKSFAKGLPFSRLVRNQLWLGSFSPNEMEYLVTEKYKPFIRDVLRPIRELEEETKDFQTTDAISYATTLHYLHNDILVKLDRATMLTSLEARTPFLDVDVAEFLMKLPVEYKQNKNLLKELMRGRIPEAIIDRQKKGFGIPLGYWLKGPLFDWAANILSADTLQSQGIFNPESVQQMLEDHKAGKHDLRKQLWTLIVFQIWYDNWVTAK